MSVLVNPELVEPVARGLLGAIDVDDGPTAEQLTVLDTIVRHLWHRDDLDIRSLGGLSPSAFALAVPDVDARRRFHELLVTLEICRHPQSAAQVARVEEYAAALGLGGPELAMFRDLVDRGAERAAQDFTRFFDSMIVARSEPSLRSVSIVVDAPEPEIVARIESLRELDPGTLGAALIDFYRRNQVDMPGSRASNVNHMYVDHDMIHVISGIEPTGQGEIALGAFQMAMSDTPASTFAFYSPLIVHEAGFVDLDNIVQTEGTLSRPGAIELMGQAFERGAQCTVDFAFIDHLKIADMPLSELREQFGVQAPENPADGHHHWVN